MREREESGLRRLERKKKRKKNLLRGPTPVKSPPKSQRPRAVPDCRCWRTTRPRMASSRTVSRPQRSHEKRVERDRWRLPRTCASTSSSSLSSCPRFFCHFSPNSDSATSVLLLLLPLLLCRSSRSSSSRAGRRTLLADGAASCRLTVWYAASMVGML